MSPNNRRSIGGSVSVHASSANARQSLPDPASGSQKVIANRNVKRRVHSGMKSRGDKTRPLRSTPVSVSPTTAARAAKKEINKASSLSRRTGRGIAAGGRKSAKAARGKKPLLRKAALNTKEHGGLFINEKRLSTASSPVPSSITTASSLRLSPTAFASGSCGRSPRASATEGGGLSPSAYNAAVTQCSPKRESTRRPSDLGTPRNGRKSGGFFSWLWKMWS